MLESSALIKVQAFMCPNWMLGNGPHHKSQIIGMLGRTVLSLSSYQSDYNELIFTLSGSDISIFQVYVTLYFESHSAQSQALLLVSQCT
jgi:hypothetical protein